jgi:hypothetical protein
LGILALVALQSYQLLFSSWVSANYNSTKTKDVSVFLSTVSTEKSVMFYQAPELVLFFKGFKYYQYVESIGTDATRKQKDNLVLAGVPDEVIISAGLYEQKQGLLSKYKKKTAFSGYYLLEK